jgi:hypothetical protein
LLPVLEAVAVRPKTNVVNPDHVPERRGVVPDPERREVVPDPEIGKRPSRKENHALAEVVQGLEIVKDDQGLVIERAGRDPGTGNVVINY